MSIKINGETQYASDFKSQEEYRKLKKRTICMKHKVIAFSLNCNIERNPKDEKLGGVPLNFINTFSEASGLYQLMG